MSEVAIVGVGCVGFLPILLELSYKELMFEAAVKAYEGAVCPNMKLNTLERIYALLNRLCGCNGVVCG